MPEYQPIDYRLRCHTKRTDLPSDVLRDIGEAYAEIERLREELRECESLLDEYRRVEMDRDRWDSLREDTNE